MTGSEGRGLSGQLVALLGRRIVTGELAPGEVIDLEEVAVEAGVSRTVVREAVKVLTGKGLLDARPRTGTAVRDRRDWSMLDPDVMAWRLADGPDPRLFQELEEIRQMLEPVAARLAATRRTRGHLSSMEHALRDLVVGPDAAAFSDADLRFHRALAAATSNELLDQLAALLQPAHRTRDELTYASTPDRRASLAAHQQVFEAIRDGDGAAAEHAMTVLLAGAHRDTDSMLQGRKKRGADHG